MGIWALSANNAEFVSVDLIGEKNQVILELRIYHGVAIAASEAVYIHHMYDPMERFFTATAPTLSRSISTEYAYRK